MKFSQVNPNSAPALIDYLMGVTAGGVDFRVTLANLITILLKTTYLSNPYKFNVCLAAAWTTGSGSFQKVPIDTKTFDTSNNVDVVTNRRFVAPVSGYYQFNFSGSNGGGSNFLIASIFKNGAELTRGGKLSTGASNSGAGSTGSDLVYLVAGDYVELWIYSSAAVSIENGTTGVRPLMSGFLVSIT